MSWADVVDDGLLVVLILGLVLGGMFIYGRYIKR